MRAICLLGFLVCSFAADIKEDSIPETRPALSDTPSLRSLKARPIGRGGYDDDTHAPLMAPIEFPFHHAQDEFSPYQRDLMAERKSVLKRLSIQKGTKDAASNVTAPWFDLAAAVARSIMDPIRVPELRFTTPPAPKYGGPSGRTQFLEGSFFLKQALPDTRINWTTCEEFGKKAYFHPQEITNLNWVPFYIWSDVPMPATVHRFMVPTKKVVESYRSKQERFLNFTLDWNQPKLLLREGTTEALLIALDRRGKFRALPWIAGLEETSVMLIRPMTVHLKIEAPYLVYMHCDWHHTAIMSVMGTGPRSKSQKIEEAESIRFKGVGYPVRPFAGPPPRSTLRGAGVLRASSAAKESRE